MKKSSMFLAFIFSSIVHCTALAGPHFASGIKVGEVDQTSAIIWVRLTENENVDFDSVTFKAMRKAQGDQALRMPTYIVPGYGGKIRIRYRATHQTEKNTPWVMVSEASDFTHQFKLTGLLPNTRYSYEVEALPTDDSSMVAKEIGTFKTAPSKKQTTPIEFVVTSCQAMNSIDSTSTGHVVYQQMLALKPDFFVHTGDILYYDKAPFSKTVAEARAKWNLMFAYGHNRNFHQLVPSYFMKDDHDTLKNDCWPGQTYGDLSFEQGLDIFREQVPMGEKTYRTVRWGKDVQIWLTENRDFRSPNTMPDSSAKTILGAEQKAWLKKGVSESDATYKFVISPGPIVGPDKKGKKDNHANDAFYTEGQELRDFLSQQKNTYVICGDRHWQYCSKDPKTGLLELGTGSINDAHNHGGNPGKNETFHRYFSPKGGFLSISVMDGQATARWYGANATPSLLHTEQL